MRLLKIFGGLISFYYLCVMEIQRVIQKSKSGSTHIVNTVYFEVTSANTLAAAVLLHDYYRQRDVDKILTIGDKMRKVSFSRTYLNKVVAEKGVLSCSYCPKTNLIIEEHGMRVPNNNKATIDHIVPISKGGGVFDVANVCVCCGKCNTKKGNKSLKQFLADREYQKEQKRLRLKAKNRRIKEKKRLAYQEFQQTQQSLAA